MVLPSALLLFAASLCYQRSKLQWKEKHIDSLPLTTRITAVSEVYGDDHHIGSVNGPVAASETSNLSNSIISTAVVSDSTTSRGLTRLKKASTAPATTLLSLKENHDSCSGKVRSGGFALALSFHDQQTWACGNLYALQHWAISANMTVLEPFLIHTNLEIPAQTLGPSDLPLSQLYDMEYWNEQGLKNGNAPTVTWDCFIHSAPQKLVLVYTNGFVGTCDYAKLRDQTKLLIVSFGFRVVREVCLNAKTHHRLSIPEFNQRILGNLSPDAVTVVFREWSQRTVGDILDMDSAHLPVALARNLPLKPSKWIEKDTIVYISRNLDSKFVAILFRSEWLTMFSSPAKFNEAMLNCLNKTLSYLKAAKSQVNASSVFLGTDIGKYGSATIEPEKQEIARNAIEKHLLRSVFSTTDITSIPKWEATFEAVAQSRVPGYIALLQRSIAVRASCLLLMGSGSFLQQAAHQYKTLHPNKTEHCYLLTEGKCNIFKSAGIKIS